MLYSTSNKQTVNPSRLSVKHIALIFAILISLPWLLVKAQTAPIKEWDARFGGSGIDNLNSLQQTTDGGYILGGTSNSGISGDKTQASQGFEDYWIVKTDANGIKQWDKRFGGIGYDILNSLQQTADGGYILGGYSSSGISGDKTQTSQGFSDYWIVKTDAYGVKQWDVRFGGAKFDLFYCLQQTADGGYLLGGGSFSGISGDKTQASQGSYDYWIVKIWDGIIDCSTPEGLLATNITTTSALLNWNPVADASSYKLRYKEKNTETWTIVKPPTNKWFLTGLTAGTAYVWKVKSVCATDSILVSDFSPKEIFTTAPLKMSAEVSLENSMEIYPNPSSGEATIHFNLLQSSFVTLKIFDVNGKEIHTSVNQKLEAGDHSFSINTAHFAKGVYVVRMISEEGMINQKLVVQ